MNGSQTKRYFEKELSEHSKTAVVPGFRKGKAPRPVLINQLGPKIASKACTELIQATVREVLSQPRYTPLSRASLSEKEEDVIKTFQPGNPFSFWFTVSCVFLVSLERLCSPPFVSSMPIRRFNSKKITEVCV